MDKKFKHMDLVQNVVNRMAQNSFFLKGWSVTLVAGLLALSSAIEEGMVLVSICFLPVIVFWILDGYFLWQERLFREFYDSVRNKQEAEIDFSMDVTPHLGGRNTWFRSVFSKTLSIFYLTLVLVLIGVIIYLSLQPETVADQESLKSPLLFL